MKKIKITLLIILLPMSVGIWGFVLYYGFSRKGSSSSSSGGASSEPSISSSLNLSPSDTTNLNGDVNMYETSVLFVLALVVIAVVAVVATLIVKERRASRYK
ncbi:hypothetical protein LC040_15715 [Bacillus tianshenii]|nr:hypothetical protein LC040_15715 [Bacillus tianshenii]